MSRRSTFLQGVRRIVVKVGSQVVAPGGHLDDDVLDQLCEGLLWLRENDHEVVLVTSGAVAAGRRQLGLAQRPRTIPMKQASAAAGQIVILQSYAARLMPRGQAVAQVLLTADDLRDRRRFVNARNTLSTLLALGAMPIVNENDTVAVEEIKLGDNDRLSSLVANLVEAQLLIVLTDVDGFYDRDPTEDDEALRYEWIETLTEEHFSQAGPTTSTVGLGGMATKLEAARQAAASGTSTVIANGMQPRILQRILDGENVGTWIAGGEGMGTRKHWIAYSSEPKGELVIDGGAADALTRRGKSLLPSGIVGVQGTFQRGEMVRIVSQEGVEIARGLAGYSVADLSRIRGHRSSKIEEILGYKYFDEAVHRDNLAILDGNSAKSRIRRKAKDGVRNGE